MGHTVLKIAKKKEEVIEIYMTKIHHSKPNDVIFIAYLGSYGLVAAY